MFKHTYPVIIAALMGQGAWAGSLITPISQTRTVFVTAYADEGWDSCNACAGGQWPEYGSESDAALDFGPFDAQVSITTGVMGAAGDASASHISEILSTSITGEGGASASAEVDPWECDDGCVVQPFSDGSGQSVMDIVFTLEASSQYTLVGVLTSGGDAYSLAGVQLTGPGGVIFSESVATVGERKIVPFDTACTLAPGEYWLTVTADASPDFLFLDLGSASASFTID